MRLQTFQNAVAAGVSEDRATVLSFAFRTMYFMGCAFPDGIMVESKKYWPKECLENPLYL
jgi:hypothetical protein